MYVSSYGLCATAGCGRQGDDGVTSIEESDVGVVEFVRMSRIASTIKCQNVVASTASHVLQLSAVLWVRDARIWVAPVVEILVTEGRWKLSKA